MCVSLVGETTADVVHQMGEAAPLADLVEIRGDFCLDADLGRIRAVARTPLVYTCRARSQGGRLSDDDPVRGARLVEASRLGFDFVDVELTCGFREAAAAKAGRGLILSHHDLEGTPDSLDGLYADMVRAGADLVKIATTPRAIGDVERLFQFAERIRDAGARPLVAIAMGPLGQATRVLGGRYDAPFTYASLRTGAETAGGQISAHVLRNCYHSNRVTQATRVYGVAGGDVTRSLSPAIHNAAFAEAGLDAVYVPFSTDDAQGLFDLARFLDVRGLSVTRPFKTAVATQLDELDEAARTTQSVNTVTFTHEGPIGASTDGRGVADPLARRRDLRGARVAILGAGGAARAAAHALHRAGCRVALFARDDAKAEAAARGLGLAAGQWARRGEGAWDIAINATPLGSHEAREETPLPAERLRKGGIVFDMVYSPLETRLLREARAAGCSVVDGIEMLVGQAAAQFELWTGARAPISVMDAAARRAAEEAA